MSCSWECWLPYARRSTKSQCFLGLVIQDVVVMIRVCNAKILTACCASNTWTFFARSRSKIREGRVVKSFIFWRLILILACLMQDMLVIGIESTVQDDDAYEGPYHVPQGEIIITEIWREDSGIKYDHVWREELDDCVSSMMAVEWVAFLHSWNPAIYLWSWYSYHTRARSLRLWKQHT